MTAPEPPLLLAVDGNSLLHRAHHAMAGGDDRDAAGRPVWALRGLVSFIAAAAARLRPTAVLVGWDCPERSVRREEYPQYKAQRADKPEDLVLQLEEAPRLLTAAGFAVAGHEGYEADDILASAARLAGEAGWHTTLMTSDRDSFALVGPATRVLRLRNGGIDEAALVTEESVAQLCGVPPARYRDYAALRGDTSDNLPGAAGIGAKTAARLLTAFPGVSEVYAALDGGDRQAVVDAVGPAATATLADPDTRTRVELNRRLMAMHDRLALPSLDRMRLPLVPELVQVALRRRGIRLGPSLWALVGAEPLPLEDFARVQVPEPEPDQLPDGEAVPGNFAGREPAAHPAAGPFVAGHLVAGQAAAGQPAGGPVAAVAAAVRRLGRGRRVPAVPAGQLTLF